MAVVVPANPGQKTCKQRRLLLGMVTSIWKNNKQPKLVTSALPLQHVVAFRCTELLPMDRSVSSWYAKEDSCAWVLKPETLVAVLATAPHENAVALKADNLQVQLSGESVAMLDDLKSVEEWWPQLEEDEGDTARASGLFTSRRKRKRASGDANRAKSAKHQEQACEKTKKNSKEKYKLKTSLLKRARREKQVTFEPKNCRRNGNGPLLVTQTMMKLRKLEETKFGGNGGTILCFDVDGKCSVTHPKCEGMLWEDVAKKAHDFFCAECLNSDSVQVCYFIPSHIFSFYFHLFPFSSQLPLENFRVF